jgi:hypothetical protein
MIENEQQREFSRQQLERLRAAVERLRQKYPKEREFNVFSYGARLHVEQIEREIAESSPPKKRCR